MKKLILISIIFIICLVGVLGVECGSTPTDGCEVTVDTTFVPNTYILPHGITVSDSNVVLDLNNSILKGNGSSYNFGVFTTFSRVENITILNGYVTNYSANYKTFNDINIHFENLISVNGTIYPFYVSDTFNFTIKDSLFLNNTQSLRYALFIDNSFNGIIHNNTFNSVYYSLWAKDSFNITFENNDVYYVTSKAVDYENVTGGFIERNNIKNVNDTGILIDTLSKNIVISYNNVSDIFDTGNSGIMGFNCTNITIQYNNITNSTHNGIDLDCWGSTIRFNDISDFDHNGIDLWKFHVGTIVNGGNNFIYSNRIFESKSDTGSAGIWIGNSINNSIFNNSLVDILGTDAFDKGIGIGGNLTYNNKIYNNSINNVKYCIWESSNNTVWRNNILSSCTTDPILIKNTDNEIGVLNDRSTSFINNTYLDGVLHYFIESQSMNITINDINNNVILVNKTGVGDFVFNYIGFKDLYILNNSITINSDNNIVTYTITSGESWEVNERTNCWLPYDDFFINQSVKICSSKTFFNDDGDNGIFIMNATGVTLNGSGSIVIGDFSSGSIGVSRASFFKNMRVTGMNLSGYDYGIFYPGGNNNAVIDFNEIYARITGIQTRFSINQSINNNVITTWNIQDLEHSGIRMFDGDDSTSNNSIYNNIIYNSTTGIRVEDKIKKVSIYNNFIFKPGIVGWGGTGIHVTDSAIGSLIYNNNVYDSGWNGVSVQGNDSIVYNNYINNSYHHGMDLNSGSVYPLVPDNISVNNNTFVFSESFGSHDCIFLKNTTNVSLVGNTCVNSNQNGILTSKGSFDNLIIENNSIDLSLDSSGFACIQIGTDKIGIDDTLIRTNTFGNCGKLEYWLFNRNQTILDNIYDSGIVRIKLGSSFVNMFLNESSSQHQVNWSNAGLLTMTYNGRKELQINNITTDVFVDLNTVQYNMSFGQDWEINERTNCWLPYDGLTFATSGFVCNGYYYVNDTGADGVIQITGDNVVLEGHGATLDGEYTLVGQGISTTTTERVNVTITNFTLIDYTRGIRTKEDENSTFKNLNVYNSTYGIYLHGNGFGNRVYNNYIQNSSTYGISIENNNNYTYVYDNIINFTNYGINLEDGSLNAQIYNNYIYYSTRQAVRTIQSTDFLRLYNNYFFNNSGSTQLVRIQSNNTLIYNNTLIESSWNCIDFSGSNISVYLNNISVCSHGGIDMYSGNDGISDGFNNKIYNNTLTDASLDGGSSIYIRTQNNNSVYFNTVINGFIGVEGNNSMNYDNRVFNNTFTGTAKYNFYSGAVSSRWSDNIIQSTVTLENIYIGAFFKEINQPNNSTFINNIYDSGIVKYRVWNLNNTIFFNETSSLYHQINLSSGGFMRWFGNSRKELTINNITIDLNQLGLYNTLFNSSSALPQGQNVASITQTIPSANRVFVFSYRSSSQPQFSSIATTYANVFYNFRSTLNVVVTGSGNATLSNLTSLPGFATTYKVTKNGGLVGFFGTTLFTITSQGTYDFSGSPDFSMSNTTRGIVVVTGIIVALVVIGALTLVITTGELSAAFLIMIIVASIVMTIILKFITEIT